VIITINQINNNLQIINYIARIDPIKRLQVYIDHNNITLVPFEDKVREQYIDDIEKCQDINTQLDDWSLDRHKLANIFNDITVSNGIDGINVVYQSCLFSYNVFKTLTVTQFFINKINAFCKKYDHYDSIHTHTHNMCLLYTLLT
jgi:hypothetical protein